MKNRIEIIPAIDIIGGKCVRLTQGDYSRCTTYCEDPLEMARMFEDNGAGRLHLVDLDGAKASNPVNLRVLERITDQTALKVEFGGGIKSRAAADSVFSAGASRVICGSVACTNPDFFISLLESHGGDKVVLGADVRSGKVAVGGWLEDSAFTVSELYRRYIPHGLSVAIVTDISKDGMLQGPTVGLYRSLLSEFPEVETIASGGVSSVKDIEDLSSAGVSSVIVGKAFYEGRIGINFFEK